MAEASQRAPSPASASRPSGKDIEGVGKFKVAVAAKGNRYKDKFNILRERYDAVTATQTDLQKELNNASAKLKKLQAENDLLLDAMQIVVPSQPTLQVILGQLSPQAETPLALNGHGQAYPLPERANGDSLHIEYDAVQAHSDYPPADDMNGR